MAVIRSIIEMKGADHGQVRATLRHLKDSEDIPYARIGLAEKDGEAVELSIEYPLNVFDRSVSQFVAVLFGEIALMKDFGNLQFIGLELPEEVYGWFGGPAYGVDEILTRFHVDEFPMLVGIIKPSLGPSLDVATIDRKLREVLSGGIHGVKDDEMQGDLPFARLSERINLAEKYGRYIPTLNLDDADSYLGILMNEKIGMALLNASIIGFPMLRTLRMMTRIPLLSHVAMQGTYLDSFCPKVFAQLHRLFGCDAFITPIGDVGYYRIDKGQEQDMVHEFVKELPIRKTLPLLTGGARLRNLREVMTPYQAFDIPYGIVFGTQIFGSDEGPAEMARVVVEKVAEIKAQG